MVSLGFFLTHPFLLWMWVSDISILGDVLVDLSVWIYSPPGLTFLVRLEFATGYDISEPYFASRLKRTTFVYWSALV